MKRKSWISRELDTAGIKAQYDEHVKRILGSRQVLARILKGTIEGYRSYSPEEITLWIEPDIEIASVPLCPGEEKMDDRLINGENTESKVPGEATIISNYLTVSSWGMLDTYQVLIVPYLTSAMGIFLFRQFYMTFPISLYESAKLDGCSNLKFIVRILLPLTKSAIGAMAVYTFINAWNMYMWPLLVTGSNNMRTVQIGISMLDSVDSQSITLMIAGVVMIIIPSISIFIVGQKQLIRGMFSGAVKG